MTATVHAEFVSSDHRVSTAPDVRTDDRESPGYYTGPVREARAIIAAIRQQMNREPSALVMVVLEARLAAAGFDASESDLRAVAECISRGELNEVAIY